MDGILAATLEDNRLSRGEKHAIEELLRGGDIRPDDHALFRSRAFALAKEKLPTHDARQVLEWLEGVVKALARVSDPRDQPKSGVSEVHFSPGPACLGAIVRQLEHAKKSVDVCVFTITDDRLASALLDAHRRHVTLRILTDDDKAGDKGSDVHRLASAGVEVRVDQSDHHMHHKFAIFDDAVVVTGSYNWTRSAAEYNAENILVTDDARLVSPYRRKFETMWERIAPRGR